MLSGQKYEMAKKFGVKAVTSKWLKDSIEKKSCQEHIFYQVEDPKSELLLIILSLRRELISS